MGRTGHSIGGPCLQQVSDDKLLGSYDYIIKCQLNIPVFSILFSLTPCFASINPATLSGAIDRVGTRLLGNLEKTTQDSESFSSIRLLLLDFCVSRSHPSY